MFSLAETILIMLATVTLAIVAWIALAAPVLINVEIYKMEDGSYIYCATGSLTDPPATHIGSGAVPAGDESYC